MLPFSYAASATVPAVSSASMANAMDRLRAAAAANGSLPGPFVLPPYQALDPAAFGAGASFPGFDPRTLTRFMTDEPKPQHSYIGLISMAIMSVPDQKMVLSDIYQWILDNYPYFRTRGPGWRNSIRHNLSLNDCFIKAGRSANGKGHYWAVHPANVDDFKRGDFRRRRAQRKARKAMGYQVADDDEDDDVPALSPPHGLHVPPGLPGMPFPAGLFPGMLQQRASLSLAAAAAQLSFAMDQQQQTAIAAEKSPKAEDKKRAFDVASLLAPDGKAPEPNPLEATMPDMTAMLQRLYGLPGGPGAGPFGQLPPALWSRLPVTAAMSPKQVSPNSDKTPSTSQSPTADSPNAAAQWQETFARIMARSYASRMAPTMVPTPSKDHKTSSTPPMSVTNTD